MTTSTTTNTTTTTTTAIETPNNNSTVVVDVTITSDLVCPWCYVGLKNLMMASKNIGVKPNITWKPYQLRPNTPEDGIPKGGTPASRVGVHLANAGRRAGINFTGLTEKTPNTLLFHAAMHMLQNDPDLNQSIVTAFQESAFEAYYTLGIFPDKVGLLTAVENMKKKQNDNNDGDMVDILYKKLSLLFKDEEKLATMRHEAKKEVRDASRRGITGVPFFEFDDEPAFSGAQPVATFEQWLQRHASMEA